MSQLSQSIPRRFGFVDVTLRDGHQCLWSTRMTTAMMTPILGTLDRVGYEYVNILGGAVFDVCVRFLHENPYRRVALLCSRLATPCDALTRGQSLYTFELFPDDVVALNSRVLADLGIRVLTVYDALNDNRNVESSVRSAHEAGMLVNTMITYTLSPVHTDAYYVERARELRALSADFISIKDPTGLLTPERARTLFPAIVAAAGAIPVQLHSHCQSGLAPEVYQIAIETGFRHGYTAAEPLANGASLPATEDIDARAKALGFVTGIDRQALAEVSGYFSWLAEREGKPRGRDREIRSGALRASGARRHDLEPAHAAAGRRDGGSSAGDPRGSRAGAPRSRLSDRGEPVRAIHRHAGGAQRRAARALQDDSRRSAQIRDGLLRQARRGAFRRIHGARQHPSAGFRHRAPCPAHPPWLPRLRAELGPDASDEELLLSAFYDKELLAPLGEAGAGVRVPHVAAPRADPAHRHPLGHLARPHSLRGRRHQSVRLIARPERGAVSLSFPTVAQLAAMAIAGLAGVIRGITGFGGAMVLTPPLALLFGPQLAIPVVLILEAFVAAPMMRDAVKHATWRTLVPITLAACVTIPLGGYVLVHADQDLLRRAIAAIVIVFALLLLKGARYTGARGLPGSVSVGAVSGALLGAAGIGGPPVILYLLSGPDTVQVTRANLTLYVALISIAGLTMLAARGILNATALESTLFLAPLYLIGVLLGGRLFARFSDRRFRQFTLLLLLAVSTFIMLA